MCSNFWGPGPQCFLCTSADSWNVEKVKLCNWHYLNDKGMVRMCGYIKDTSNKYSLAFLSSSPPGCHGTAQHNWSKVLQSMQASLESCEETFQLCILRLLISMIPTSVQSHASPSAGRWCFPFFLSPNYKNDHKQDRERVVVIKTWSSLAVFLRPLTATELIDVGQHHSGPAKWPFKSTFFRRCSPNFKHWWRNTILHYDKQKQK